MASDLRVAILISDAIDIIALSSSFKKMGILPQLFSNIDEAFLFLNQDDLDLLIVDVKKMSEGDRLLKDHIKIKNSKIPLCFYYSENTIPLLDSTYNIFSYGTIRRSSNYDGEVKVILQRINKVRELSNINNTLNKKLAYLSSQTKKLNEEVLNIKEKENNNVWVLDFFKFLEISLGNNDFSSALAMSVNNWNIISAFSCYELVPSGNRLISPVFKLEKYVELTSLWPGKNSKDGIEVFAENIAIQTAMESLGDNMITLRIQGKSSLSNILLFIKVDSIYLRTIDWKYIETNLSNLYRFHLLKTIRLRNDFSKDKDISPWRFLSILDTEFYNDIPASESKHVILVNFSRLISLIKDNPKLRFNWASFEYDFLFHMKRNVETYDFSVINWGIENFALVVSDKYFDNFFDDVKIFTHKFSYWRYFEDSSSILTIELAPEVKSIPVSSTAFMRYVDRDSAYMLSDKSSISKTPSLDM